MKVQWAPQAIQDRIEIMDYLAVESPGAAAQMDLLFSEATEKLAAHPAMGRLGIIPGTRELIPHASYRIVYELYKGKVWILALVHTARQWPPLHK